MRESGDSERETDPADADAAKQRSPVERTLVWGLIGVLLVVVGIESHARFGYSTTLNRFKTLVEQNEQGSDYLTVSKARESIAGSPSEASLDSAARNGIIRLSWFSLLKSYEMDLEVETESQSDDPMFLGYSTPDAPMDELPIVRTDSQVDDAAATGAVPASENPSTPPGNGVPSSDIDVGSGPADDVDGSDQTRQRPPVDQPTGDERN